jgi:hypothetical protein
MRKLNLARLLRGRPEGIFINPFEQGEIGPDLFRKACEFGLGGLVSKLVSGTIRDASAQRNIARQQNETAQAHLLGVTRAARRSNELMAMRHHQPRKIATRH